ncbi:MAG: DUF4250 domain-containing protein [Muribaculaceae bacterium]|nr:DUF4250 domain-containing protein [Muribaculaceae bacterium]
MALPTSLPSDPHMLYSVINMKLRDQYPDLAALCDDLAIDPAELRQVLGDAGYSYDPATNRFI